MSKFSKLVQISKSGFIFGLWGWARWTGLLPDLTQKCHQLHHHIHHHQPSCKPTTSSVCAIRVFSRMREWCVIIGLPVPWVCLLCQHARCTRSVSVCQRVIPEVSVFPWTFPGGSSCPRCPEGQDIVPLCQMAQNLQDCTYGSDLFVMMILCVFLSHVTAYWLCLSPLIV